MINVLNPNAVSTAGDASAKHPRRSVALNALRMAMCASVLSVALPGGAYATNFCVGSGDDLYQALEEAEGNGASDVIRIRVGTMRTLWSVGGATWNLNYSPFGGGGVGGLSISGGWNSDCSQQTLDPTLTVLDGQNLRPVLGIFSTSPLPGRDSMQLSVSNLTLDRGRAISSFVVAGLTVQLTDGVQGDSISVENVVVTRSSSADFPAGNAGPRVVSLVSTAGNVRFRNSVVYNNNVSAALGGNTVSVITDQTAVALISNNSIFGNVGSSAFGGGMQVLGVATLSNNVIAENSSTNSSGTMQLCILSAATVTLVNNHIPALGCSGVPFSNVGTTVGAAQWSGSGPFRVPNVGSPLRDSGTNSPTGGLATTDVRGLPRVVNVLVDRGAVEAQPPANTGPTITALDPLAGSTTTLPATSGPIRTTQLLFLTQAGTGTAQTTLDCQATGGSGVVTFRGLQTISNGGWALPVDVAIDNPAPGGGSVQASFVCNVSRENANSYSLTYQFVVSDQPLFRNGFE